ncbi:hypothetical protein GCM10010873_21580 [Cypionkella aquatica]|uniref:Uncharacterized protein n=1 Tax=Cypionkella aquatica TaxID=1756042 RepID=A0AA37X0S0_9RHOB|nr:hypothetical protein [Cypionkella aquatica]GLS87184.1 hypothetical protein GCM10010873_21580 [Cypionkella aquatica]
MQRALPIAMAYLATAALMPLLLLGARMFWFIPTPERIGFVSIPQLYFAIALIAAIISLPGFALVRVTLWRISARSVFAFAIGGAFAGILSGVIVCLPDHLWVLWRYNLITMAATIGGLGGVIYCQIERALINASMSASNSLNSGANGK